MTVYRCGIVLKEWHKNPLRNRHFLGSQTCRNGFRGRVSQVRILPGPQITRFSCSLRVHLTGRAPLNYRNAVVEGATTTLSIAGDSTPSLQLLTTICASAHRSCSQGRREAYGHRHRCSRLLISCCISGTLSSTEDVAKPCTSLQNPLT
jgi:hypothetical protein